MIAGLTAGVTPRGSGASATNLPKPTKAQQVWQDCELGIIYHFDLPIVAGVFAGNNTVRERLDPALYNPVKLDTDQWIEAAKAMGARYAVFTATHFNGFMQWQSDLYPYGVKQAKWRSGKGDVVADFVESCREADILPGIYFSTHRNVYHQVWGHYVGWGEGRGTPAHERFNRIAEKMTEELCSRYGDLVQIWYDAGVKTPAEGGPDVLPIFERCQPDSVFYHNRQRSDIRWIGNEKGFAGDPCWATMPSADGEVSHNAESWKPLLATGDPDGAAWSPGMVDVPFRGSQGIHNWFWRPDQDHAIESVDRLMEMYDQSVGQNCNFIIGEVVTSAGLVPEGDILRLTEFGQALKRRFSNSLGAASGSAMSLEWQLTNPGKVGQVVLMEDISHGQRVREYRIEALAAGGSWAEVGRGKSIGHKWIHRIDPVDAAALRITVTKAAAPPVFRKVEAFGA